MKVCSKCWETECEHKREDYYVEIDDNISDIIILLNKKGYRTSFCCGGHGRYRDSIYIAFDKWHCCNLPSILKEKPLGKYWKQTYGDTVITSVVPKKIKEKDGIEKFLEDRRDELRKYVEDLKNFSDVLDITKYSV